MPKLFNRARMTVSGAAGTGNVTLNAAVAKCQTFASAGALNGDVIRVVFEDDGDAWEISEITYSTTGPSLTGRTLVESSTGSLLSLTANAEVYIDATAEDVIGEHLPTGGAAALDPLPFIDVTDGKLKTQIIGNISLALFNNDTAGFFKTAGTGLSGNEDTVSVDLSQLTDMTVSMVGTDEFIVLDNGADRRKAANEIGLSIFNNDMEVTEFGGTITSSVNFDEANDSFLISDNSTGNLAYASASTIGLSGFNNDAGFADTEGTGIDITSGTVSIKIASLTDLTGVIASNDEMLILDRSEFPALEKRKAISEITLSTFNVDLNWNDLDTTSTLTSTYGTSDLLAGYDNSLNQNRYFNPTNWPLYTFGNDSLTKGYHSDTDSKGTVSSGTYTPEVDSTATSGEIENFKTLIANGAFTLAPPSTSNNCTIIIQVTNSTGASTITTSGFTIVNGDTYETTNGNDYLFHIKKVGSFTALTIEALQ